MTTASAALPGFSAPAASFDEPFAMLSGCHERVERTLRLLGKLVEHVATKGSDAQAQSAATDVLRYFDVAAPRHHEDEELHVFPLLLAQTGEMQPALGGHVRRMQADHVLMNEVWAELRPLLQAVAAGAPPPPDLRAGADRFAALYGSHIDTEERLLYPAAAGLIAPEALRQMSDDMRRRRTAPGAAGPAAG